MLPARATNTISILFPSVLFLHVLGLGLELYLIEHFEDTRQIIPLAGLLALLLSLVFYQTTGREMLLISSFVVAALVFITGVLGIYFHLEGNYEFALEMYPKESTGFLLKKTLHGATPVLAPGSMVGLGLITFIYLLLKKRSII
jgi:hypothetical protein